MTLNPWTVLFIAIFFGTLGTTCLKLSEGFKRKWPALGVGIFYGLSFFTLTLVLKRIDMGLGYAVWSGLSTVMIAIIGAVFFRESVSFLKIVSLILIVMGIAGLKISA